MGSAPTWTEADLKRHRRSASRQTGAEDKAGATGEEEDSAAEGQAEDLPAPSVQVARVPGLGPSQNDAYSGKLRGRIIKKRRWGDKVKEHAAHLTKPARFPVRVLYRTYIPKGRNPRDADGASAAAKIAIDALEELGVLPSDARDHVARVTLEAPRRADVLYTEIVLMEA